MSDAGDTNGGKKGGSAGNDWVAKELEKARKDYEKEAAIKIKILGTYVNDGARLKAGARVRSLRDGVVYWDDLKLATYLDSNRKNWNKYNREVEKARTEFKEITFFLDSQHSHGYAVNEQKTFEKWEKLYTKETGKMPSFRIFRHHVPDGEFRDWLLEKKKEVGKKLNTAKKRAREYANNYYQCKFALEYHEKYGTPTKRNGKGGNSGGSDGFDSGGGAVTDKSKEEVLQTDENGNKLIRITDADGNQSFVVEDKDKNRKSIKDEEVKKTSVKAEDIQDAISKGDWKALLTLLLKAIGERDQQASQQQLNDGQGGKQPEFTEYKDEVGKEIYKVGKLDGKITSIILQKGEASFELTVEHFQKAGVDPTKIEEALKAGKYPEAESAMLMTGYKTGVLKRPNPELEVKGNDIILKDQLYRTGESDKLFVLNEQYLVEKCGMKKGKAEKTMENLRELAKSDKTNQGAAYIIASYFAKEQPAPKMPKVQANYGSPKLNRNPGGKVITITVKDSSGKERELGYKEFAAVFGCNDEEAKKLRKECIRTIKNGGNVDGVLSFVANNSQEKSYFWTKSATKIGTYALGAAAVGVGAYAAFGGFNKSNNEDTPTPTDTETLSKSEPERLETTTTTTTTNEEDTRTVTTNNGAKDSGTPNLFNQMKQNTR